MYNNARIWLFRILALACTALLVVSWLLPWWGADVEALALKNAIVIHPWGLVSNMGDDTQYVPGWGTYMPGWFAPFMWCYLALAVIAVLIGSWMKDKSINFLGKKLNLSALLIGIAGFSYVVVVIIAVIMISVEAGGLFGIPLVGRVWIALGGHAEQSWVASHILSGYWLSCVAGPLLIILALLRNRIIGISKN